MDNPALVLTAFFLCVAGICLCSFAASESRYNPFRRPPPKHYRGRWVFYYRRKPTKNGYLRGWLYRPEGK